MKYYFLIINIITAIFKDKETKAQKDSITYKQTAY